MDKQTQELASLNTVQTVLSEQAVTSLENILYWFWNDFDSERLTQNLMKMLEIYIKANPDDMHRTQKPDMMARRVSEVLQLNEQLASAKEMAKPWRWVDTPDGWRNLVGESE